MSLTKEYIEKIGWQELCTAIDNTLSIGRNEITHFIEVVGDVLLHEVGDVVVSNQQSAAVVYNTWHDAGTIRTTELCGTECLALFPREPDFEVEFIYLNPFIVYKRKSNEQSISQSGPKQS